MKWFGLAFLLLLGFTEAQYGCPQCNIIAEEVLQQKQPLITQLKTFAASQDFRSRWYSYFNDEQPWWLYRDEDEDYIRTMEEIHRLVQPYKVVAKILNVTLDTAGIVSAQEVKLRQSQVRRRQLKNLYGNQVDYLFNPFTIFHKRFVDYNSLANTSRCEPCIDYIKFSSCLYNELNEIKAGLTIFQEVAVYSDQFSSIVNDADNLLKKMFTNFTVTTEQIFNYYRNTRLPEAYNTYISDLEYRYGGYLRGSILKSVTKFTKIVQAFLDEVKEPINIQDTCVGSVLKDVITRIKPYLTPIAKTLPKWNFDKIVSSYVNYGLNFSMLPAITLIRRFEEGFENYRRSVFPAYREDGAEYDPYPDYSNPYSNHISSIIYKGFTDLTLCSDFELVYSNSTFRCFVDKGIYGEYGQAFVMDYLDSMYYTVNC